MNKSFFQTLQWQLSLRMMGAGVVIGIIGSFFVKDLWPFWLGMITGTICSVVKIYMMEASINKALQMDKKQANLYTNVQYILRYTLTAGVLIVLAITQPPIAILGGTIGLFTMKIAVYIYQFQENKNKKIKKAKESVQE
ncbi:MAG: hypothetical protein GX962_08590 [Epulopiscium sp.]|nr:hypothetical protein [Candidatus Epulonipiscium sp.]